MPDLFSAISGGFKAFQAIKKYAPKSADPASQKILQNVENVGKRLSIFNPFAKKEQSVLQSDNPFIQKNIQDIQPSLSLLGGKGFLDKDPVSSLVEKYRSPEKKAQANAINTKSNSFYDAQFVSPKTAYSSSFQAKSYNDWANSLGPDKLKEEITKAIPLLEEQKKKEAFVKKALGVPDHIPYFELQSTAQKKVREAEDNFQKILEITNKAKELSGVGGILTGLFSSKKPYNPELAGDENSFNKFINSAVSNFTSPASVIKAIEGYTGYNIAEDIAKYGFPGGGALGVQPSAKYEKEQPIIPAVLSSPSGTGYKNISDVPTSGRINAMVKGFVSGSELLGGTGEISKNPIAQEAGSAIPLSPLDLILGAKYFTKAKSLLKKGFDPVKEAVLYKNKYIDPVEFKRAVQQVTSGVEQNVSTEAVAAAKNAINNAQKGESLISQIKSGANIRVKRDFLGWLGDYFKKVPAEDMQPKLAGFLESIRKLPENNNQIGKLTDQALKIFNPKGSNFQGVIPSIKDLGKFAQLKGGKVGVAGIDYPSALPEEKETKLVSEAKKYGSAEEFVNAQTEKGYRSVHQIDIKTASPVTEINENVLSKFIDEYKNQYGYPSLKSKEISKLKSIISNDPDTDVTVYRASPENELNSGDWVTVDKAYANDIKRQNGGKVYTHTVKAKDLFYPKTMEGFKELPSLNKWTSFQYQSSKTKSQLIDIWEKAHSEKKPPISSAPPKNPESVMKISNDLYNSPAASEVLSEMENAQAGERIVSEAGETVGVKSSFPDWVPGSKFGVSPLRTRSLFDQVIAHFKNGTIPKSKNAIDLYNIVKEEISKRSDLPWLESPVSSSTSFKKPLLEQKTGETKVSKIGKSIELKAIEEKLTHGFSEIAEYSPITIKDQAKKSTDLINSDIDKTRRIIRGEEELPEGLKGTALITAMEERIKANPDAEMAYELANSFLVSSTSSAAQELRLAAERDPDSAMAKLQEILKVREAKASTLIGERQMIARRMAKKAEVDLRKDFNATLKDLSMEHKKMIKVGEKEEAKSIKEQMKSLRKDFSQQIKKTSKPESIKQVKRSVMREIEDETNKINLSAEDLEWDKFLSDIEC